MPQYYSYTDIERSVFLFENWGAIDSSYSFEENTIGFSFLSSISEDDVRVFNEYIEVDAPFEFSPLSEAERDIVRFYFEYLDSFLSLSFTEMTADANTIAFGKHNIQDFSGYAWYPPFDGYDGVFFDLERTELDNLDYFKNKIIPHEIGHALGLLHTFEGDQVLAKDIDNVLNSVMSYNNIAYSEGLNSSVGIGKYAAGFRELDIYALIELYGEQSSAQEDIYVLNNNGVFSHDDTWWSISIETPFVLIDTGGRNQLLAYNLSFDGVAVFVFDEGLYSPEVQNISILERVDDWDFDINSLTVLDSIQQIGVLPILSLYPETIIFSYSGTLTDDRVFGNDLPQSYIDSGGANWFFGGGGNDSFFGYWGDADTAAFSGQMQNYSVSLVQALSDSFRLSVSDRRGDGDGTDSLTGIEFLEFADGTFDIGIRAGAVTLSQEDFAAITELYIAYFDRAPASKGLLYWADRLADGMTLPEIAESFFVQTETQITYDGYLNADGSLNNAEAFVNAVFNNLLGRDPSGPYWVNELNTNPDITPAIFILAVLNGAKAASGNPADAAYLADKTDIGVYFSAIKGLSDYDDTIAVMDLYDGSDASIANAVAVIDQIYAEALDPNTGEFLLSLVGVIDDPFAIA